MLLLILGVLLFVVVHFGKTTFATQRAALADRIGNNRVKGLVALILLSSIWLIVLGWSSADFAVLWTAPIWLKHVTVALMLPALIVYAGSFPGSALRARLRHPQLTGFKLWAALHLLVNGDTRSLILFGGLLAWAVVEVILINKRDGKPPLPAASEKTLVAWASVPIGILLWLGLLLMHEWLFGVGPLA